MLVRYEKIRAQVQYAPIALLLIGMAVRMIVYWQDRSLIIDEANLARNVVEKSYQALFAALRYEQYAPPVFTAISKCCIDILGVNEFALKLLPLVAGLVSVGLFGWVVHRQIKNKAVRVYLLWLFVFSVPLIRYSTEFKQYSVDVAICLGFLAALLQQEGKEWTSRRYILWALAGGIGVWCSMPLIFVLAAVGIHFLYQSEGNRRHIIGLMGVGAVWIMSFGSYFYAILYKDTLAPNLKDFHNPFFFNLAITNNRIFWEDWGLLEGFFRTATDRTILSISWAILCFGVGAYRLIRTNRPRALLLLLPLILTIIASHLEIYTLLERLVLFLIPFNLLVIGTGIEAIWGRAPKPARYFILLIFCISMVNKDGYRYLWERMELEDSKTILRQLKTAAKQGDFIFVEHNAVPAFIFYNEMHEQAFHLRNTYLGKWDTDVPKVLKGALNAEQQAPFWVVYAHTTPEDIAKSLHTIRTVGNEKEHFQAVCASVYQFNTKN